MELLKQYDAYKLAKMEDKELLQVLLEEVKVSDKLEIARAVAQLRATRVEKQKQEIIDSMKAEIAQAIKLAELVKSDDTAGFVKEQAYKKLLEYMGKTKRIYSTEFFYATKGLLDYAIKMEDVHGIDFLMKKRTQMLSTTAARTVSQIHVDAVLKIDAKKGFDDLAQQHIKSAIAIEYGDLVRRHKDTASYYYLGKEGYQEQYYRYKTSMKSSAEAVEE